MHIQSLDVLSIIGLVIILAYLGSRGLAKFGFPQVVGYILVGVLLGSSFLHIVPLALVNELDFITEIALGLIGFEMGSHLRFKDLRQVGSSIFFILIGESLGAFLLVAGGVYLFTNSVYTALIFGALATATAPAATVDVLAEYRAKGPLTTTLLAVVGMDDALALMFFSIATAIASSILSGGGQISILEMLKLPVIEIGNALVLGVGIGTVVQWALEYLKKQEHALCAFIVGIIFFTAGVANSLGASLVLTTMVMGLILVNWKEDQSEYMHCVAGRVGPLIYILFFVLVGTRVQVSILPQIGLLGVLYLVLRILGKYGGAWLGGRLGKADSKVRNNLGLGLLSQAGVAIGLALSIAGRFDKYGEPGVILGNSVINVITATTFVVQIVGPIMVKRAIVNAGEAGKA